MPVSIRFRTRAPLRSSSGTPASARTPRAARPCAGSRARSRSNGVNSHLCGLTTSESASLGAAQDPFVSGHHRRDAGIRGVDVQPDALARADRRRSPAPDRRSSIDVVPTVATTASGSQPAARSSAIARGERVGTHAELGVRRNLAQRLVAEPEQDHRLVDRRVRLLGAVDAHARHVGAAGKPARADRRARPPRAPRRARAASRSTRCRR